MTTIVNISIKISSECLELIHDSVVMRYPIIHAENGYKIIKLDKAYKWLNDDVINYFRSNGFIDCYNRNEFDYINLVTKKIYVVE